MNLIHYAKKNIKKKIAVLGGAEDEDAQALVDYLEYFRTVTFILSDFFFKLSPLYKKKKLETSKK